MASGFRTEIGYNTAKLRALGALARMPDQWWNVEDWAREVAIHPTRRMYTYALRLIDYGLVSRAGIRGRLVYRITSEGIQRQLWLRRVLDKNSH